MISKSVPIATPSDFLILRYYTYWKRVSNTKKRLCLEMSVFRHFGSWNLENQNIENCHARIIKMQKCEFRKIGQSNRVAASQRVSLGPKQLSHKVSSEILETRFFIFDNIFSNFRVFIFFRTRMVAIQNGAYREY